MAIVETTTEVGRTRSLRDATKGGSVRLPSLKFSGDRWLPYLLPVVIVALWQILSSVGFISTRVMPSPADVLKAFWATTVSGKLPYDMAVSAGRAVAGLVVGGAIGFAFGILNGVSKLAEQLTDTSLQMLRTIPHLALIPSSCGSASARNRSSSSPRSACSSPSISTPITAYAMSIAISSRWAASTA
jgi:sulfonate transport system permease protein